MKSLINVMFVTSVALSGASALAGPLYTFSVSEGTQPSDVGVVTLTQVDDYSVRVSVDLLPGYGFVNTGGKHTPFAFSLTGSAPSISSFTTPADGFYLVGINVYQFSLNSDGGENTPYGSFAIALDSNAPNGSGFGYFGDLDFTLYRAGGLDTNDFVQNDDNDPIVGGSFFSADISNGSNTGAQAWAERAEDSFRLTALDTLDATVPLPSTLALFGLGVVGLGLRNRKQL